MRAAFAVVALLLATSVPALAATSPADLAAGKSLFKTRCGKCHTLAAAGTVAKDPDGVGPVLTGMHLTATKVLHMMATGSDLMPSFLGTLTSNQMNQVAVFVASATKTR